jgi:hypothetical protein
MDPFPTYPVGSDRQSRGERRLPGTIERPSLLDEPFEGGRLNHPGGILDLLEWNWRSLPFDPVEFGNIGFLTGRYRSVLGFGLQWRMRFLRRAEDRRS